MSLLTSDKIIKLKNVAFNTKHHRADLNSLRIQPNNGKLINFLTKSIVSADLCTFTKEILIKGQLL